MKAACILQTLVFSQKEDTGLTREQAAQMNWEEVKRCQQTPDRTRTRYQILDETERSMVLSSSM